MSYSRRTTLTVLGGLAIAYATAGTSGAFDFIEVERSMAVSVDGDSASYLAIEPHPDRLDDDPAIVGLDADGLVFLDFTEVSLNDDGTTQFHDVMQVTNNGQHNIDLQIDALAGTADYGAVSFYVSTAPMLTDLAVDAGDSLDVGIEFDTSTTDSLDEIDRVRIIAEAQ